MPNKRPERSRRELRSLRIQQLIFVLIGVLLILSLVLSLVVNF